MRHAIPAWTVAVVLAFALVHCANDEAELGATHVDADGAPPDDGASDAGDAGRPPEGDDASTDAGDGCSLDHWCRTKLPSKDFDLQAVWSFASNDTLAVGRNGMIHWDGAAWSLDPTAGLEGLTSLWASGPNDVWAVAEVERRLVHGVRASGGAFAWTTDSRADGPTRDLVRGASADDVWIVGMRDDGTHSLEHVTMGDGGTLGSELVDIGIADFNVTAIYVAGKNDLWLGGRDQTATIVHAYKTDGPKSIWIWEKSYSVDGKSYTDFPSMWGSSANDLWAIGVAGENFHRGPTEAGIGWSATPSNATTSPLTSVWGVSTDDVWAVGYLGAVRHWDGKAWSISRTAVHGAPIFDNFAAVHASSAEDVWAVGHGIAIHRMQGAKP
ncbi:hypothetical protein AKJ09_11261 [Labilithrix luteola]|uniref:Type IV fimbrial biogenesis protein PilY1 n=1 Tax=Labilithrix luteola TaxID=1391654 RepID=A0A0K1QFU8_9BACT|nr:hypothetical protein [Labilithrix luteola]AKV04598.1 hypothetical protein AKJ09_11261 [Labilithrix luteola]